MRKHVLLVPVALAWLGCSTAPESFLVQTPSPQNDAFSCVVRKVNALGFTVEGADRDAGFVRASKQTSGLGTALLTGKKYHDQLTVSIFDAGNGRNTIRVTAAQSNESALGLGNLSKDEGNKPSPSGRAAARDVLTSCGEGDVTQQQSMKGLEMTAAARAAA